jgi:hypothetical protein
MIDKQTLDLTAQDIAVIQSALHTQEKILSVQSRASGDGAVVTRLNDLKRVLKTLHRQTPDETGSGWRSVTRALFG